MTPLKPMTQEEREAVNIARLEKKAYAEANYIQNFSDENAWRELASRYNTRLPIRSAGPMEMKHLKRTARKVGVDIEQFVESTGFTTLKSFCMSNPKWPQYALVSLYLEYADEILSK